MKHCPYVLICIWRDGGSKDSEIFELKNNLDINLHNIGDVGLTHCTYVNVLILRRHNTEICSDPRGILVINT